MSILQYYNYNQMILITYHTLSIEGIYNTNSQMREHH